MEYLCLFIHHTIWIPIYKPSEIPSTCNLNQALPKNLPKFWPTQKNPAENFKLKTINPSITLVTWNPEDPPPLVF